MTTMAFSQVVDYADVGVIINDNSQTSIDIGTYFQQERNIPNENMIHVSAPVTEEIDSSEFEHIRIQIENYLTTSNLTKETGKKVSCWLISHVPLN